MLCSFLNKDLQRKVLFELNHPDLQMRNCFFFQLEQIDFKIMPMFKLHSLFRLNNKEGNLLHQNLTSVVAMSLAVTLPARGAYCIYAAECIVDECTHIHTHTNARTHARTHLHLVSLGDGECCIQPVRDWQLAASLPLTYDSITFDMSVKTSTTHTLAHSLLLCSSRIPRLNYLKYSTLNSWRAQAQ